MGIESSSLLIRYSFAMLVNEKKVLDFKDSEVRLFW